VHEIANVMAGRWHSCESGGIEGAASSCAGWQDCLVKVQSGRGRNAREQALESSFVAGGFAVQWPVGGGHGIRVKLAAHGCQCRATMSACRAGEGRDRGGHLWDGEGGVMSPSSPVGLWGVETLPGSHGGGRCEPGSQRQWQGCRVK